MPTGYTAAIKDGITFEKFVLTCARGFGALIMMRDEPMDAPIPDEFKPSNYHREKLIEARKEKALLETFSDEAKDDYCKEYNDEQLARWEKRKAEKEALEVKYKEMLAQVIQWQPPTPDHEGLKEFMIKQIRESIDFDCNMKYDEKPEPLSVEQWFQKRKEKVELNINYHTYENRKEVKRAADRTAWVVALKDSLQLAATS